MKQQSISMIDSYEQLKAISDPLRTKMMSYLIDKPYTGHQLAKILDLSRAKILYHLRELEKHGFIELVKKEEKGGNLLKYYQAIARGFIPAEHLLNTFESLETTRNSYLEMLNRTKMRVLSAPEEAFQLNSSDVEQWPRISLKSEVKVSEERFIKFLNDYRALQNELLEESKQDSINDKHFFLMITGFKIEDPS